MSKDIKIIKMDPLAEKLEETGMKGGVGKYTGSKSFKNLMNLKKGVDVIRGTSKKRGPSSSPGNRVNDKYQGRYFFERAKTNKSDSKRIIAAKSFAKTSGDFKTVPKEDRLILKTTLTPRETAVGRRLFSRFAPRRSPFEAPSKRQGRLGRIIVPKSALKRLKVDRKLTREVRKENKGGLIQGKPKLAIKGWK